MTWRMIRDQITEGFKLTIFVYWQGLHNVWRDECLRFLSTREWSFAFHIVQIKGMSIDRNTSLTNDVFHPANMIRMTVCQQDCLYLAKLFSLAQYMLTHKSHASINDVNTITGLHKPYANLEQAPNFQLRNMLLNFANFLK